MAFEDALAVMLSLGQPYACLPRRGPSRASVRWIVAVLHADRSDRSTQEVLQGAPPRVARRSAIVCWPVKGVNNLICNREAERKKNLEKYICTPMQFMEPPKPLLQFSTLN